MPHYELQTIFRSEEAKELPMVVEETATVSDVERCGGEGPGATVRGANGRNGAPTRVEAPLMVSGAGRLDDNGL